jgi:transcriptional regulator with XRE-family HTH domain
MQTNRSPDTGPHWSVRSQDDQQFWVINDFIESVDDILHERSWTRKELARRLGKTQGRVPQMLRNPRNLTVKGMVAVARALDLKVGVVLYDSEYPVSGRNWIKPACWRTKPPQ